MTTTQGIIGAGNWIVDTTKIIDVYPSQDTLADIEVENRNNGGGAFNILINLARLGAEYPLHAIGLIGEDAAGDWIIEQCRQFRIETSQLARHESHPTSYTDVMTVRSTGRRTFFHQRGANRAFGSEHFSWEHVSGKIFYLGYLLLLDSLDAPDPVHGTVAARILHTAGQRGLYRVVDLVSVERPDYADIVDPSLPEIDMLICNELEASRVTGIPVRDSSECCRPEELRRAGEKLLGRGVRDWVVIHLPEGAYARSTNGEEVWQGRVQLPPAKIVGAAGAGDAFAAGMLHGLHEKATILQSLRYGVCAAAASLRDASTSAGIATLAECEALGVEHGYLRFP